ncbi:LIM domain and actin-binding protein 1-like isoform X2 [Ctenocephalides felis]|uniref:LIM domain and actin-binding protein 1-like isoform X2 n=1 Tax=Ctenocephalides felis TaxID=7515 RepID=UPI000E6E3239|nr:LIM domain and actin-binding protein 1-like isoform X2 [Ctenocephalides felis]
MEKFEKGEAFVSARENDQEAKGIEQEDMSVFDAGICKKSRSMFLELDASAAKSAQSPHTPHAPRTPELKKSNTQTESPEREVYRDPSIVTSDNKSNDENGDDPEIAEKSHTATKMLNIFRQMEERKETQPQGPKPLKRFTPPPEETPRRFLDTNDQSDNSGVTDSDTDDEVQNENEPQNGHHQNGVGRDGVDYVKASDKCEDEFLKQARNEARAKQLRAKFEKWESNEIKREQSTINVLEECQTENNDSQLESAKSLRDRFESMREMTNQMNKSPRVKVNRFVEIQTNCAEYCAICEKKVYPLEKIDCNSKIYHKQCFRCVHCNAVLRMDTYTHNHGVLYCIPHFKQLFISKGNYESGFGLDPHKTKWEKQEVTANE